jgi:phosphoglucosamine mutase
LGISPDGYNINLGCGSTSPQAAADAVRRHGADLGICLDGDADRIVLIDEMGHVKDGDQVMALFARLWSEAGTLEGSTLVSTVMSNLGLERYLQGIGVTLERTKVGDRHVVERMRAGGFNLGGEQSGHIVMSDYATTGDGLVAGLQFLAAMVTGGQPASTLLHSFDPVPQKLENVTLRSGAAPLADVTVQNIIAAQEQRMEGKGRLLIRPSGTEPLIRVMAECEDEDMLNDVVATIVDAVRAAG